jgi:hypothetical protein
MLNHILLNYSVEAVSVFHITDTMRLLNFQLHFKNVLNYLVRKVQNFTIRYYFYMQQLMRIRERVYMHLRYQDYMLNKIIS